MSPFSDHLWILVALSHAGRCCRVILSYHKSCLWDRRIFPRLVQISEQPSVNVDRMEELDVTSPETVLTYCTCTVGKSMCLCATKEGTVEKAN